MPSRCWVSAALIVAALVFDLQGFLYQLLASNCLSCSCDATSSELVSVWLCSQGCWHSSRCCSGQLLMIMSPAGHWLPEFTDLRDQMNRQVHGFSIQHMRRIALEARSRILASGRDYAIPKLSERALARMEAEAARSAAVEEQGKEDRLLEKLEAMQAKQALASERRTALVA